MLKQYLDETKVEVGIDEAGRGCLFGPVCVAAVIWPHEDPEPCLEIKDSKKVSEKKRNLLKDYIEQNAIAWSVQFVSHEEIDQLNILQATMKGMHRCVDEIRQQLEIDTILVDGNSFPMYTDENLDYVNHECIIGGDEKVDEAVSEENNPIKKEVDIDLIGGGRQLKKIVINPNYVASDK